MAILAGLTFVLGALGPTPADAGGADLLWQIHGDLVPLRAEAPDQQAPDRGEKPIFTDVKHALRDWIEMRLTTFPGEGNEGELERELNRALRFADLLCETDQQPDGTRCSRDGDAGYGWFSGVGYLGGIGVSREGWGTFLVVTTELGIVCGEEDSAYAYQRVGDRWRRVWQSEDGAPVDAVHISPSSDVVADAGRLLLTVGADTWCSSNLGNVFYRLWRLPPGGGEPRLLLEDQSGAYRDLAPHIEGSVGSTDALIEFHGSDIDPGMLREIIRHYRVAGDRVTRIDPIALSPHDFAAEWLTHGWDEAERWTSTEHRAALRRFHESLPRFVSGEIYPITHCRSPVDRWQATVHLEEPERDAYFLVRWSPPYHFELLDVHGRPFGGCDGPDPTHDTLETLFPIQEWR